MRSIVLIGPSGSGKSAVGAALGERLGRPVIDTDEMVERITGKTIPEIFASEGEEGFRRHERKAVAEAAGVKGAVVACGGGAVTDESNVETLRRSGIVIYLRVSPPVAARRIGDKKDRPLLEGGPVAERLAALIDQRAAGYLAASDLVLDADDDLETVVGRVLQEVAT